MHTCLLCINKNCCLNSIRNDKNLFDIEALNIKRTMVNKGAPFIKKKQHIGLLYPVFQGVFKSVHYRTDEKEEAQLAKIYWFQFPGDLLEIEDARVFQHAIQTIAIQDAIVCEIPLDGLQKQPLLMNAIYRNIILSTNEFAFSSVHLLSQTTAKIRLLLFLSYLRERLSLKPYQTLILPISKQDIGNYLGIASETVSRLLKLLVEENEIEMHGKEIVIKKDLRKGEIWGF